MDSKYSIVEVSNQETRKAFLEFPVRLYQGEKNWIRPLDIDIENTFDPASNKLFQHGECIRWDSQKW